MKVNSIDYEALYMLIDDYCIKHKPNLFHGKLEVTLKDTPEEVFVLEWEHNMCKLIYKGDVVHKCSGVIECLQHIKENAVPHYNLSFITLLKLVQMLKHDWGLKFQIEDSKTFHVQDLTTTLCGKTVPEWSVRVITQLIDEAYEEFKGEYYE